jgi:beta-glucosidase
VAGDGRSGATSALRRGIPVIGCSDDGSHAGPWGDALVAAVRAGRVSEPGGRLPTTWPAGTEGLPSTRPVNGALPYDEGLFVGYRAYDRDGREPRFRFGHGLGYTTWEYLDASAEPAADGGATARVRLRNTGDRAGREVVQVYLARPGSAVERPPRWLAGFATEPGAYEVHVGRSSGALPMRTEVEPG